MTGAQSRDEYYWQGAHVVPYRNFRPSGQGPWPQSPHHMCSNLIAWFEDSGERLTMGRGSKGSEELVAEAILAHHHMAEVDAFTDFSTQIPAELLSRVAEQVELAEAEVTSQLRQHANEPQTNGAFWGNLSTRLNLVQADDWQLTAQHQHFSDASRGSKESKIGADTGLLFEVRVGKRRIVKSALIQAKRAAVPPTTRAELPRANEQMLKMLKITPEAYILTFHSTGITCLDSADQALTAKGLIVDAFQCVRGDRARDVVATALLRDHVVRFKATTGSPP